MPKRQAMRVVQPKPPKKDDLRGTGRTTRGMQMLPKGGVFIWHSSNLEYPSELLKNINREDITVVSPHWLSDRRWMGLTFSGIHVDHHAQLTREQWVCLDQARLRVRT